MKRICIVVVVVAACKSNPESKPTAGSNAAAVTIGSGSAAATKATTKHAQATKDQLAKMHVEMKAGWAAQKAKQWADAVTHFEAALKILDGDARALAELGWSAMNAGDFAKARTADEAAVRAAVDPKVKGASLYNLGLVQLRLNDQAAAARSFATSLALRPNKIVEAEFAKIGKPEAATADPCAGKKPCECILERGMYNEPEKCELSTETKSPVDGWHVYAVKEGMDGGSYLFDDRDQFIAMIDESHEHMRRYGGTDLVKSEIITKGTHKVLRLELTDHDTTDSMSETHSASEDYTTKHAVYCAIGDAKTPTKCFDAPLAITDIIDTTEIKDNGEFGAMNQKRTETTFDVTLGDDGVVTVKLATGAGDVVPAGTLGPHPLW